MPTAVNLLEQHIGMTPERRTINRVCASLILAMTGMTAGVLLAQGIIEKDNEEIAKGAIGIAICLLIIRLCSSIEHCVRRIAIHGGHLLDGNEMLTSNLSANDVAHIQTTLSTLGITDIQVNEQTDAQGIRHASSVIARKENSILDAQSYNRRLKPVFFKTTNELKIPNVISQLMADYAVEDPIIRPSM